MAFAARLLARYGVAVRIPRGMGAVRASLVRFLVGAFLLFPALLDLRAIRGLPRRGIVAARLRLLPGFRRPQSCNHKPIRISSPKAPRMSKWRRLSPPFSKPGDSSKRVAFAFVP